MDLFAKQTIKTLSIDDENYPAEWRALPDAPKTVDYVGDLALLQERKLTVVGSRLTPAHALKLGEKIVAELCSAFVIVTGTADGGDGAAIEGALQSGKIICVLAGGFSAIPQGNLSSLEKVAQQGLLLSPYSYQTPIRAFSYEYRNKLLAALSEGTLVLGAGAKSGALITAEYAKKFQKTVMAFPYAPSSAVGEGCNALIKSGGTLVENADDVAKALGAWIETPKPKIILSNEENALYQALRQCGELHINELSESTGIPPFKARAVLSALEVKGCIVALGGNRYSAV